MFFKHFQYLLIPILAIETKYVTIKDCPFAHTVDLLDSMLLPNGSYLYKNHTLIPKELVGDYNYTILVNQTDAKDLETHKRGCICAVKQCLRICSDTFGEFYKNYTSECVDEGYRKNVTLHSGFSVSKHLFYDFHLIYGNVCAIEMAYMLEPELEFGNEWTLYEDSTLLRHNDKRNLSLDEYCFDVVIKDADFNFLVNPVVCGETVEISWFSIWAMTFSIPFLFATIICYKCLICKDSISTCFQVYLFHVTASYTLICSYTISGINLTEVPCVIFGFTLYFTIVSYLTWTCILSYDTWKAITTINDSRPSFSTYAKVGYTVPLCMTFATFLAQILEIPDSWSPGISTDMCAVNTFRWSAVIYYYIPGIVVCIFSLTLYIKIMVFRRNHNAELHALFGHEPGPLFERFSFFFRTFLFMGISWSLDIVKYFLRMFYGAEQKSIYLFLDLFNAFYGVFVFLTFICRPSILKKLKNWFERKFKRSKV